MSELRKIAIDKGVSSTALKEIATFELFGLDRQLVDKISSGKVGDKNPINSLLAFELGITTQKPISKFSLIYDRQQEPDIDLDYSEEARAVAADYVTEKYGADHVANIGTHTEFGVKTAFTDICSICGADYKKAQSIAMNYFPDPPASHNAENMPTMKKIFASAIPEVKEELTHFIEENIIKSVSFINSVEEFCNIVDGVIGALKASSVHACGLAVSSEPLGLYIPLRLDNNGFPCTQLPVKDVEKMCSKIDLLTISTLDTIKGVMRRANISKIPIEPFDLDPGTMEMIRNGETYGCFQIGTSGISNLCKTIGRSNIEALKNIDNIGALIALFRPGPINAGMMKEYCDRVAGKEPVTYMHPLLEPILKDNYGIILYQEDIMRLAVDIAGYSREESDLMRYAVAKKIEKDLLEHHDKFVNGCVSKSEFTLEQAQELWDKIVTFAYYGFNKSHAVAYAYVSYMTAWLKYNYRTFFYTEYLNTRKSAEDVIFCIKQAESESGNLKVKPPDINKSEIEFSPLDEHNVIYGLQDIRGIGSIIAENIINSRPEEGYKDIRELVMNSPDKTSRGVLEKLCWSGSLDNLVPDDTIVLKRNRIIAEIEAYTNIKKDNKRRAGLKKEENRIQLPYELPEDFTIGVFGLRDICEKEKTSLGRYVTAHPTDIIPELSGSYKIGKSIERSYRSRDGYDIIGLVTSCNIATTQKDNKKYIKGNIEDSTGECMFFIFENDKNKDIIRESIAKLALGTLVCGHVSSHLKQDENKVIFSEVTVITNDMLEKIGVNEVI